MLLWLFGEEGDLTALIQINGKTGLMLIRCLETGSHQLVEQELTGYATHLMHAQNNSL